MLRTLILACALMLAAASGGAGPLHTAAEVGDVEAAEALISSGSDVDEIEYPGGAPLHIAARRGHLGIVELLISAGADLDALEYVKDETPLHIAAAAGHEKIVEALIEAGADIEARGNWGYTPLLKAIDNEHQETALRLIELGADIRSESDSGITSLHKAGEASLWAVIEVLLSHGAGPTKPEEISSLLPAADPQRGAQHYEDEGCKSCHDLKVGGVGNAAGPSLWNVVGRDIASIEDFAYSEALLRQEGRWSYDNLNRLLANASGFFPGTNMIVMGNLIEISDPMTRASIIAYLRLQADEPFPLP